MIERRISQELFQAAQQWIPGGVNSPVRTFASVDDFPAFIERGAGSRIFDADGREYIDYVMSWGALILGHSHPEVVKAVQARCERGFGYGAATPEETLLAKKVVSAFPAMDMVRFVSSGTEACMTAIRIARAYTRRDKILKFTGHYHGHSDGLLVKAGSGIATLNLPSSLGVPASVVEHTLLAPFNDLEAVKAVFQAWKGQIAGVIVEPFAGNSGFIRAKEGFLEGLRELCSEEGSVLIFDEVMTGFRVCWGGVQNLLNIAPDLTTLGKVIGGGLPIAAVGGKRELMSQLAPLGGVYQAGTLSGNPLAVLAGLKSLEILEREGSYARLAEITQQLLRGIEDAARNQGHAVQTDAEGAMFGFFFSSETVSSFEDAQKANLAFFKSFFRKAFYKGVYWPPSMYEAAFMSLAHTKQDIEKTVNVVEEAFRDMRS